MVCHCNDLSIQKHSNPPYDQISQLMYHHLGHQQSLTESQTLPAREQLLGVRLLCTLFECLSCTSANLLLADTLEVPILLERTSWGDFGSLLLNIIIDQTQYGHGHMHAHLAVCCMNTLFQQCVVILFIEQRVYLKT